MYSTLADRQRSPESFHLRDKVAYLVVCHYHVGACTCQVVHDNLFQGSDAMAVLEEVIKTFSTEGDYIMDLTGKSGIAIKLWGHRWG